MFYRVEEVQSTKERTRLHIRVCFIKTSSATHSANKYFTALHGFTATNLKTSACFHDATAKYKNSCCLFFLGFSLISILWRYRTISYNLAISPITSKDYFGSLIACCRTRVQCPSAFWWSAGLRSEITLIVFMPTSFSADHCLLIFPKMTTDQNPWVQHILAHV